MTLTIEYPVSGTVRTHRNLTQRQVNKLLSHISDCQDTVGEVAVRAKVSDEDTPGGTGTVPVQLRRATVLDFHAGEVH